jgi:hypothetical protein
MKPVIKIRLIALVLTLFIAVGLGLPYLSFADRMSVRSGKSRSLLRTTTRSSGHVKPVPSSPKRRKFFVVQDPFEQTISVSVQQTIMVPPAKPEKKAKNMVYFQPRWVETEHGVLVLEPGHWLDLEPGAEY